MQVSSDVPVVKQFSWGLAIRGVLDLSELQSFVENRKDFGKSVEKLCNINMCIVFIYTYIYIYMYIICKYTYIWN